MRVLMAWSDFLAKNPELASQYEEATRKSVDEMDPEYVDEFYYRVVGTEAKRWQPADEYGERAWRIVGDNYSIVVWDDGNGWSTPLGVEIEVESFTYVKR